MASLYLRFQAIFLLVLASAHLTAQSWVPVASTPIGSERYNAVSFSIGGKGYITTGQTTSTTLSSTWEYDPEADTWTPLANFPGGHRRVAAGFAIGNKGYLICGRDDTTQTGVLHNDVWEFDPAENTWMQKANFPGGNRENLVAFSIGASGYAGLGLAGSRKLDFYRYDPAGDSWTQLPDIGYYDHHYNTSVFVLNGKGYFATGLAYSSTTFSNYTSGKVYMFDPATGLWTQKNDFAGAARLYGTAFTVNNKAYMGLGYNGPFLTDLWQYDDANDSWTQMSDFTPGGRLYTSTFTLGNRIYVGNGRASDSQSLRTFYSWDASLSTHSAATAAIQAYVNRTEIVLATEQPGNYSATIFNLDGKTVLTRNIDMGSGQCTIEHQLHPGIYVLSVSGTGGAMHKKIVVP